MAHRITEPQRKIIRAMHPTRGITVEQFAIVAGSLWRKSAQSLMTKDMIERGDSSQGDKVANRFFLTERGKHYRERLLFASDVMGDLSYIGNGFSELASRGQTWNRTGGPYGKAISRR